jgi:hypothetical protein
VTITAQQLVLDLSRATRPANTVTLSLAAQLGNLRPTDGRERLLVNLVRCGLDERALTPAAALIDALDQFPLTARQQEEALA